MVGGTSTALSGMRRNRPLLTLLLLALLLPASALAQTGAEIYKAHCSACHGAQGAGDTMLGKNLKLRPLGSNEVQSRSDDEIAAIIGKGKNKMPRYDSKLTKEQIRELVKQIRSLKQ